MMKNIAHIFRCTKKYCNLIKILIWGLLENKKIIVLCISQIKPKQFDKIRVKYKG